MQEWNETVQKMIDWLEINLTKTPSLMEMSKQIGYSPYYCSTRFHEAVGITLKQYLAGRRLSRAAVEIRDSDARILDIAMQYGFSSQQALTRAFVDAYGCTPAAYRKKPTPVSFRNKKELLFPDVYDQKGVVAVDQTNLKEANVRVTYIPAHKYIAVFDPETQAYFPFWQEKDGDSICGVIESMSHVAHAMVTCHTAGWYFPDGKRGYSYGVGVPLDYSGPVPEGFELREYPESYYLQFYHPSFDFLRDCEEVMRRVDEMAFHFNPADKGFCWNEALCQDYQCMMPETYGYEVLRPVCKL